ncbi:MAG TPA: VWA domain-containing protein [Bryobacteraceae bacterium]|nr:VWA domain-containing protein [Bryobacteraceae bacterium]
MGIVQKISFFGLMLMAFVAVPAQEGPNKDVGETVAKPRKPDAPPPDDNQAPIPSKLSNKNKADLPPGAPAFKVDTSVVNVDVAVLDNKGHFIPNIPRGNFRVLEDNVPQQVSTFSMGEAPMTVCMLIEFNAKFQRFYSMKWYETLTASYGFLQTLKPDDYVAVIAYDLRTTILSDFSSDKRKAYEAMQMLRIPGFSESNMFDALADTEDRMSGIEGRKAIVLIATGIDTFSKLTYDKARKALQEAGVPIYPIGLLEMVGMYGGLPNMGITTMQAENELKTFAKETGGMAFIPRFFGELPTIYQAISQSLRNQYSIAYSSTNQAKDGTYRKIKVELVNPATNEPLRVTDEKGKPVKYSIVAKTGYKAPREVE